MADEVKSLSGLISKATKEVTYFLNSTSVFVGQLMKLTDDPKVFLNLVSYLRRTTIKNIAIAAK